MVLPHEAMESSSLCSDSNSSMSWRRVDGPFTSKRSHSVHFHPSVMVPTGGAIGSEKPKKGSARFTNPFLLSSRKTTKWPARSETCRVAAVAAEKDLHTRAVTTTTFT